MKMFVFVLTLLVSLCVSSQLKAEGWTNPMVLPGLANRSLGDPYIMKYRGYYYLYVSAGASASAAPLQLYNLQGQQLSASAPTPRGIYIVREDRRSRKVMR